MCILFIYVSIRAFLNVFDKFSKYVFDNGKKNKTYIDNNMIDNSKYYNNLYQYCHHITKMMMMMKIMIMMSVILPTG